MNPRERRRQARLRWRSLRDRAVALLLEEPILGPKDLAEISAQDVVQAEDGRLFLRAGGGELHLSLRQQEALLPWLEISHSWDREGPLFPAFSGRPLNPNMLEALRRRPHDP